jgi:hypothetical protein
VIYKSLNLVLALVLLNGEWNEKSNEKCNEFFPSLVVTLHKTRKNM